MTANRNDGHFRPNSKHFLSWKIWQVGHWPLIRIMITQFYSKWRSEDLSWNTKLCFLKSESTIFALRYWIYFSFEGEKVEITHSNSRSYSIIVLYVTHHTRRRNCAQFYFHENFQEILQRTFRSDIWGSMWIVYSQYFAMWSLSLLQTYWIQL